MMSDNAIDELKRFIRAGGAFSLTEWYGLNKEAQVLCVQERERIRIEDAIRIGTAASGPAGAAEVLAPLDDGRMRDRMSLRELALEGLGPDAPAAPRAPEETA